MRTAVTVIVLICVLIGIVVADDLRVTVYNSNIGVIKDTRSIELERGTNKISIDEVASRIDPTSVRLAIEGQGQIEVLEQNFEYDLVSPDKLLRKYLDDRISLATEDDKEYDGILLGFDGRDVVLDLDQGGVAIVARNKVTDIILPPSRKGLVVTPTLFWMVNSSMSTPAEAEIAYITEAINWHAEYVATVGDQEKSLGIASWVSIDNQCGATFPGARLKLVAGEVHRVREMPIPPTRAAETLQAAIPRMEERPFFEYHMYTLDGVTTLKDKEVKQIQLFPEAEVVARKQYDFDRYKGDRVRVVMRFENSEDSGLGIPLPKGKVRVFKADLDGSLEFVGEDEIDHTPKDEEVKLYVGDAFDIRAERQRKDFTKVSDKVVMETFEIEIANHKDEDITITVTEHIFGDWTIRSSSHPYNKIKADVVEFEVPVEADGTVAITYTVRRKL